MTTNMTLEELMNEVRNLLTAIAEIDPTLVQDLLRELEAGEDEDFDFFALGGTSAF